MYKKNNKHNLSQEWLKKTLSSVISPFIQDENHNYMQ